MPYNIQNVLYSDGALGGTPDDQNGIVFVPLEGVVETLNGMVSLDNLTVTVTLDNVVAFIEVAQTQVQLNQGSTTSNITLPAEPSIQGNQMFVPAMFFYQAYSRPVTYEDSTNTVSIGSLS